MKKNLNLKFIVIIFQMFLHKVKQIFFEKKLNDNICKSLDINLLL